MDEVSELMSGGARASFLAAERSPSCSTRGWNRLRRVVCSARRSSAMPRTPPSQPSFLDPPAVRAHEPRIRDAHLKLLWRSVILDGSSALRADGVTPNAMHCALERPWRKVGAPPPIEACKAGRWKQQPRSP